MMRTVAALLAVAMLVLPASALVPNKLISSRIGQCSSKLGSRVCVMLRLMLESVVQC